MRLKMPIQDRAKQFIPYKAVQGLEEAIENCNRLYQEAIIEDTKKRQAFDLSFSETKSLKGDDEKIFYRGI